MAEALQRMRRTLGENAVLVASQASEQGVRVTAAVELADTDLASLLASGAPAPLRTSIVSCLTHHAVVPALREALLSELDGIKASDPATALTQILEGRFRFLPLEADTPHKVALVGPSGAGKTASAVRLAAQAVVAGRAIRVISTGARRAGAAAQLAELLRPLGLAPEDVDHAEELKRIAGTTPQGTTLVVDCGGINPFNAAEMAGLAELLHPARVDPVLVLPAGLDAEDSVELAANFAAMGARRMIVSKLDAARRLGGVLAAADVGMAFAGAGIMPAIGRGLPSLSAVGLARVLLHRAGNAP